MKKTILHMPGRAMGLAWLLVAALAGHHLLMGGMTGGEMRGARQVQGMPYQQMQAAPAAASAGLGSGEAAGGVLSCPLMHAVFRASTVSQNDGSWVVTVALAHSPSGPGCYPSLPEARARAPSAAVLQIFRL